MLLELAFLIAFYPIKIYAESWPFFLAALVLLIHQYTLFYIESSTIHISVLLSLLLLQMVLSQIMTCSSITRQLP